MAYVTATFDAAPVRCPARQAISTSDRQCVACRSVRQSASREDAIHSVVSTQMLRRTALVSAAAAALSAAFCSVPVAATAADQTTAAPEAQEELASTSESEIYETTDFYLRVPHQFQQAAEEAAPRQQLGRGQGPPQTPLKARFLSEAQGAQLTIVAREAFQIKTLFFQCQDISQLGSPNELSRTILPPGSKLLSATSADITEPSRDLSAFQGFVQQPRQTIYRYEFETDGGLHVTMAAAARLGKIFFAGGTAPIAGWKDAKHDLQEAVGSFRLLQPVRNV